MTLATASSTETSFGQGVYSFPQAAAILHQAKPDTLRRWIRTGLIPPTYDRGAPRSDVLSFHDLISLQIVRLLRSEGVSLQRIRVLEAELRRLNGDFVRPFALNVFWTDGVEVWYQLEDEDMRLVQATGHDKNQLAWRGAVASFAHEVSYDESGSAVMWEPTDGVTLDPRIRFGEPVVKGTRVPVATIQAQLEVGTVQQVAGWYGLTVDQVGAAAHYAHLN
jgi:uncharacterized protein (DUF433 family)/DNA-binding transcriptional MerR regulator